MSTSSRQLVGNISAYLRKAVISSGKDITQLWAWVPAMGMLYIWPVSTLLVLLQPPMMAARAP